MARTEAVIDWEKCPECGSAEVVRLPANWAERVNKELAAIDIVGCGSPWHYALRGMDAPEVSAPALATIFTSVRKLHQRGCAPGQACEWCRSDALAAYEAVARIQGAGAHGEVPYPDCVALGCKLHPWVL